MDPLLLVVVGVLGYVVLGLVTARGMWRLDHTTMAGPRDTTAVVIAWPLVLVFIAAAFAAGSAHQLVTRPTGEERLEQRRAALQRRIRQLERDLELERRDDTD